MICKTPVATTGYSLLAFLVCGCTVTEFVGESMVMPDGTLTRTTRLIDCADCDEIMSDYELPAGGSWETRTITRRDDEGNEESIEAGVYEVTRSHAPGTAIPSDFARKSNSSRLARNHISVARRDYFLLTTFRYDEEFRDIQTPDEFRQAFRKIYDAWVSHAVETILEDVSGPPDAGLVRGAIKNLTDPVYETFVHGLSAADTRLMESDEAEDLWLDPDTFHLQLAAAFSDQGLSLGQDDANWESRVSRIFNFDVEKRFSDEEWAEIEDSVFGAHGFELFKTFKFSVSVRSPGKVYETNAGEKDADELRWTFSSEEFLLRPYTISVRSYLLHPLRIGIVAVLLVVATAGATVLRSRRRSAQP